jgi:hypothetical protein
MANQNSTLKLVLTHKWYDMIEAGIKTEEYRGITPYWVKRLNATRNNAIGSTRVGTDKTHVQFQRAYPKNPPRMTKAIKSIRIGTGKPELGAIEGKLYFVIELI